MIREFIKEYYTLKKSWSNEKMDDISFVYAIGNLVEEYEKELNLIELRELQVKMSDPAIQDSIKDMEEENKAFPED